ncbi:MAG: protein-glutamate O-methyltransferase CheR, partial [Leptospirales bacterium]|nr:protein-glutamate O-methyltransferase CheR [Leptospirales bacterium]
MDIQIKRMSEEDFAKFAKLIYEASGIYMKDTKITMLSNRLRKRLLALSMDEFHEYYDYLQKLSGELKKKEFEDLLDVVSTNETYFFRNERQFDALREVCLPKLANLKKDKNIRIWSAACSTGEEPYTIAICVLECMKYLQGYNIKIIANDIAHSVLEFAKDGCYSGRRIEKVSPEYLKKYFILEDEVKGIYRVKDELKSLIKFCNLNFFKDPFPENIDIIFCRNVMIYFDREHQKRLVADFYKSIND